MQWVEQRILILEQKWAAFWRDWLTLLQQVRALQQGLTAAQQQGPGRDRAADRSSLLDFAVVGGRGRRLAPGGDRLPDGAGREHGVAGDMAGLQPAGASIVAGNRAVVQPDGGGGFLYVTQSCV